MLCYVMLMYHARICSWNQPVLSNEGKVLVQGNNGSLWCGSNLWLMSNMTSDATCKKLVENVSSGWSVHAGK